MRTFLLILVTAGIFLLSSFSKKQEPVKWTTSVKKISETEYMLTVTANIQKNWHLYSNDIPAGGPVATTFYFEDTKSFEKDGGVTESEGACLKDDGVFEKPIKYFDNKAVFNQKIKLKTNEKPIIKGFVEFMVCNNNSSTCLPPQEVDLSFNLN